MTTQSVQMDLPHTESFNFENIEVEFDITSLVRAAVLDLHEKMKSAGRVPFNGATPEWVHDEATNSMRLSVLTVPMDA